MFPAHKPCQLPRNYRPEDQVPELSAWPSIESPDRLVCCHADSCSGSDAYSGTHPLPRHCRSRHRVTNGCTSVTHLVPENNWAVTILDDDGGSVTDKMGRQLTDQLPQRTGLGLSSSYTS